MQGLKDSRSPLFKPIRLADASGKRHTFSFRIQGFVAGVEVSAIEQKPQQSSGYEFKVTGSSHDDLLMLFARLIEKIRRSLSTKHIEKRESDDFRIIDRSVRARIDWDKSADHYVPLLIIDGQEITWEQFGGMLMPFEGLQFKLDIRNLSEEI